MHSACKKTRAKDINISQQGLDSKSAGGGEREERRTQKRVGEGAIHSENIQNGEGSKTFPKNVGKNNKVGSERSPQKIGGS